MKRFNVRKVAVLGAGVMGAQIAAHLVNVKVPVILFDLPAKEGPKNGIVSKAVENLKKLTPATSGNNHNADASRSPCVYSCASRLQSNAARMLSSSESVMFSLAQVTTCFTESTCVTSAPAARAASVAPPV